MTKKKFFMGLLVMVLTFGMTVVGCNNAPTDDDDGSKDDDGPKYVTGSWGTWVATLTDGSYDSTANVNITSTSTGCEVTVTGTANPADKNWAVEIYNNYTGTAGKTYIATWKWQAQESSFENVTIRYAQRLNKEHDEYYQFGTFTNKLTIPVSEETKKYMFTAPADCKLGFTFYIGEDTGSFIISDFKIVERTVSDDITIGNWTWREFGDNENAGTSTIAMTRGAGADSNKLTFSGNVMKIADYDGFAGFYAKPNNTELAKLKTATSISFKVKGDGKTYQLVLPTSDITDWDHYGTTFTASTTETTVTVNISDLTSPGWGQSQTIGFNQNNVTMVKFQTNSGARGQFNLTISDLKLNNDSESGSGGSGGGGGNGGVGNTLTLSGQVYTYTQTSDPTTNLVNNVTFTPYNGSQAINDTLSCGSGNIQNGQFSYALGTPTAAQINTSVQNIFHADDYTSITITPNNAKYAPLNYLRNENYNLSRGEVSFSTTGNIRTYNQTQIGYLYLDKDCTVTAIGKTYVDDGVSFTTSNVSLSLKRGWNIIYLNEKAAFNTTTWTQTSEVYSISGGDQAACKWVLSARNN
jgi:hypothetical protein